ncbi:MAG: hypothetical protein BWX70_02546 [Verrucomicrobia bacterium ADurb.Bin070]|nr:MAG: hypothetical protein BWX70_02546 [Verrucomicrobia bacterium ADurb.Bin070]
MILALHRLKAVLVHGNDTPLDVQTIRGIRVGTAVADAVGVCCRHGLYGDFAVLDSEVAAAHVHATLDIHDQAVGNRQIGGDARDRAVETVAEHAVCHGRESIPVRRIFKGESVGDGGVRKASRTVEHAVGNSRAIHILEREQRRSRSGTEAQVFDAPARVASGMVDGNLPHDQRQRRTIRGRLADEIELLAERGRHFRVSAGIHMNRAAVCHAVDGALDRPEGIVAPGLLACVGVAGPVVVDPHLRRLCGRCDREGQSRAGIRRRRLDGDKRHTSRQQVGRRNGSRELRAGDVGRDAFRTVPQHLGGGHEPGARHGQRKGPAIDRFEDRVHSRQHRSRIENVKGRTLDAQRAGRCQQRIARAAVRSDGQVGKCHHTGRRVLRDRSVERAEAGVVSDGQRDCADELRGDLADLIINRDGRLRIQRRSQRRAARRLRKGQRHRQVEHAGIRRGLEADGRASRRILGAAAQPRTEVNRACHRSARPAGVAAGGRSRRTTKPVVSGANNGRTIIGDRILPRLREASETVLVDERRSARNSPDIQPSRRLPCEQVAGDQRRRHDSPDRTDTQRCGVSGRGA